MVSTVPVSLIILTFNEEKNIKACLESALDFAEEIFVVDSGSTDATLDFLKNYPVKVFHHPFENYSKQRNWAFEHIPISCEWILNMDADHRLTEAFKSDVQELFAQGIDPQINGILASRKTIFMDKWIKHGGHYPTYHAVLFRKGKGKCEDKVYDQHFKVEGDTLIIKGDIIDLITDSLSTFTQRHNHWSNLEALELFQEKTHAEGTIKASLKGKNPIAKRRYLKNIYERMPLFVRPFLYFVVRYFFRLGFLDGKSGLIFHFLQCFWFRFLIDAKIYELQKQKGLRSKI